MANGKEREYKGNLSRWTDNPFRNPNASPEEVAEIKRRHRIVDEMVKKLRAKRKRGAKGTVSDTQKMAKESKDGSTD